MVKTITIHDRSYEIVREVHSRSCIGCSLFINNMTGCEDIHSDICQAEAAILVEIHTESQLEEQKYTIQELIDKLKELSYSVGGLPHLLELEQLEQLKKDPEYEEFTRLKEKFKDVI